MTEPTQPRLSFLIESSPVPIYRRITTAYRQALEKREQQVIYFDPSQSSNINEAFHALADIIDSKQIDCFLVFENSPLFNFYIEEADRFAFEFSKAAIIFIHYDNFWSSLTDPRILEAWYRVRDRSIHFCLEYTNFLDLRMMEFEQVYPISHGSEFERIDPPRDYAHEVSFVGHVLPDFNIFFEPIRHLPYSHLIAADFWSRLAALDKKLEPSAIAFAEVNQFSPRDAEFIRRKSAYHYLINLMSVTFRGELIKRLDPQNPLAIIGGDPAYLQGMSYNRQVERQGITYYPPISDYKQTQKLYASSKINLNITSPQFDQAVVNRVIDIASSGGFLLTDWKPDLHKLTTVSEEISYRTIDELNRKICYYLTHEEQRLEIADQLHQDVVKKCSYDSIIEFLLSKVLPMKNNEIRLEQHSAQPEPVWIDLGCGIHKPEGFIGVDVSLSSSAVDIVADLNQRFPFPDSSVDRVRAYDVVEHLSDRIHTMNEIWRVCKPNAEVDIRVPSTDGRGAFQDPTHVSFWNINSFNYYCEEFPAYLNLCHSYGFRGAFRVLHLTEEETGDRVIHVRAVLRAIKPDESELKNLSEALNLRAINLIILPDWHQPEEILHEALTDIIRTLALHRACQQITLLIHTAHFPENLETSAEQLLYDLVLNLLLTEEIDVANAGLEISLVEALTSDQYAAIASKISYRIPFAQEDWECVTACGLLNLPTCALNALNVLTP